MSQPAERRDLYAIDPTDPFADYNRHAQAHNDARYGRSLIKQAEEIADLRSLARRRAYARAMDLLEAQEAWRIASGALDPHVGPVDELGYPTMTEQEWIDRHGWHPPATPPPPPPTSPGDDEVEQVDDEPSTGEVPVQAPPQVPARKRGEHVETWARRVLETQPTIGWKRLSTLVGGRDVLPESPARRVVDTYRAETAR